MDILILGNGFDLAHGLKTRYTDFLDYWKKDNNVENVWLKHFVNKQKYLGDKWIDLEEEIYNVIKEIDTNLKNIQLQYNYKNEPILKLYSFQKGCIDGAFDLTKINKELTFVHDIETNEKEYKKLENDIPKYYFKTYKGLINFLYDQLRDFTKQFNKYLSEQVLPNISNSQYDFGLSLDKTIRVLNFNYTDTFERLYNSINIYSNIYSKHKYIYVHGKVSASKNCNLILGTKSFYNKKIKDLNDEEEINVEFNVFKKHNQRHRYGTIESYQGLLKELKDKRIMTEPIFHVIGHSLDESDHNILRHIFKVSENSIINIYYHNQEALERLINNITKIIGEEEVMTRVRFIHQEDPERGILIPR